MENATGQTPAELAESIYIRTTCREPSKLGSSNEVGPQLAKRQPAEFFTAGGAEDLQKAQTPTVNPNLDAITKTWLACTKVRGTEKGRDTIAPKRKLVSVLQANEVARRLATRNSVNLQRKRTIVASTRSWVPRSRNSSEEAEFKDEVDLWYLNRLSDGQKWYP